MKHGKLMDCDESMMAIPSINHDITNKVRNNSNCNIVMADCNNNGSFNSTLKIMPKIWWGGRD